MIYVSNANSGDLSLLANSTQQNTLVNLGRLALGGTLMPMSQAPNKKRLYVAKRDDPTKVFVIDISQQDRPVVCSEVAWPGSVAYLSVDPSEEWLFSASYHQGWVSVSRINQDGLVDVPHQLLNVGEKAHSIAMHPRHSCVFVACLGTDEFWIHNWNSKAGVLSPRLAWKNRPGSGPRHFRFHPRDSWVYLLNELDATLDFFHFDGHVLEHRQTLSLWNDEDDEAPWAADLQITCDGHSLIASERRKSRLSLCRIDADSGELSLVQQIVTEKTPRGMSVSSDGHELYVVGQDSNHLSRYLIEAECLTLLQRIEVGQNPNWIEVYS